MTKQIIKDLENTKKLIKNPENWVSHWASKKEIKEGKHCILTALSLTTNPNYNRFAQVRDIIGSYISTPSNAIGQWNDTHTHKEVIKLLNKIIKDKKNE